MGLPCHRLDYVGAHEDLGTNVLVGAGGVGVLHCPVYHHHSAILEFAVVDDRAEITGFKEEHGGGRGPHHFGAVVDSV